MGRPRVLVDDLFQIADRAGDPELRLQAHHAAWGTTTFLGEVRAAHDHVNRGLELYTESHRGHALLYGGHDPGVCGKALGALSLWMLGYPEQARRSAKTKRLFSPKAWIMRPAWRMPWRLPGSVTNCVATHRW